VELCENNRTEEIKACESGEEERRTAAEN